MAIDNAPRVWFSLCMRTDLIMVRLVEAIYWFDETLQKRLDALGFHGITRAQSIILANIANGEIRPARLAEKLGISKQGISQALGDMQSRGMINLVTATFPQPRDG
jgi:DNA-binding MarR family transcriptional regulator